MAIYQRGKNWYIDFTFKGQRIRESIGPSRKGAEKVIAKRKAEIAENKYLDVRKDPDPVTFHEFAKDYLKWAKGAHKASTYPTTVSSVRALDREFQNKGLHEITSWEIEQYKVRRKKEVKPASVNRELAMIKHMYSKAIEAGKVKGNPARKVKFLKGIAKRCRYLMPDEFQNLLSYCGEDLKLIATMGAHTGMRRAEIVNLQPGQVNLLQGIITLPDTKTGESQEVRLNETVKALLGKMDLSRPYIFFPDYRGMRKSLCTEISKSFKEVVKRAGIEDFHFHDLRHTFASNLIMQEGVELNDVRECLRHKSMSMTMRYAHLSPKHKTRIVGILDRVMSQNPPQENKVTSITG